MKKNLIFILISLSLYNFIYSNTYEIKIERGYPRYYTYGEITISNSIDKAVTYELYFSKNQYPNPENDILVYSNTIEPSQELVIKKDDNKKKLSLEFVEFVYLKINDDVPLVARYSNENGFSTYKYTFNICNKPTFDELEKARYYVDDDYKYLNVDIAEEEVYLPKVYYVYSLYAENDILKGVVYNTYKLNNRDDINDITYSKNPVYRPFYTQEQKEIVYEELRNVYFEYKEYKKHYEEYINTTLINTSSYKYLYTPQITTFSRRHTVGQQYIADITYYEMSRIDQNHFYVYGQLSNCIIEYSGNLRFDFSTCYRLLTYEGTISATRSDGVLMELPLYTCSSELIDMNRYVEENIKNKGERWDLIEVDFYNDDLRKQLWPDKYK